MKASLEHASKTDPYTRRFCRATSNGPELKSSPKFLDRRLHDALIAEHKEAKMENEDLDGPNP
jgi:hypothetical protein